MSSRQLLDLVHRDVVTAHPDADARDLARRMREKGVGSVVVATDGHPIGVVTDRDLAVRALAEAGAGAETAARELMSEPAVTVRDDADVAAAARAMDEHGVRRLPVVDKGEALVGVVTFDDVYRELVAEQERLAGVVAAASPD